MGQYHYTTHIGDGTHCCSGDTAWDIALLEHHPMLRRHLCERLAAEGLMCREIPSFNDLMTELRSNRRPRLVIFDLWWGGPRQSASQKYLRINCFRSRFPSQRTLVLSEVETPSVAECCLELGVSGYVGKHQPWEEVREAVNTVLAGGRYAPPGSRQYLGKEYAKSLADRLRCLTAQESRVLMMICDGMFNQQIAQGLGLTEATVKAHVSRVLRKLSVPNRTNAVVMVERLASAAV